MAEVIVIDSSSIEVQVDPVVTQVSLDASPVEVVIAPVGVQGPTGATGASGPQGPMGPKGDPGADMATFLYDQEVAASVWTIAHNLGYFPNVTTIDSAGTEVVGSLVYLDVNTVEITFAAPFGGKAFLS